MANKKLEKLLENADKSLQDSEEIFVRLDEKLAKNLTYMTQGANTNPGNLSCWDNASCIGNGICGMNGICTGNTRCSPD